MKMSLEVSMSNNKQSSVEWYANEEDKLFTSYQKGLMSTAKYILFKYKLLEQAKAQHKKETIDFALHCMMPNMEPDKSTIEVVSDIYDKYLTNENL